jgi:hypothetical protein
MYFRDGKLFCDCGAEPEMETAYVDNWSGLEEIAWLTFRCRSCGCTEKYSESSMNEHGAITMANYTKGLTV